MENKKIITFKESHRGESYVAFAENKTEIYIFNKFLTWITYYSNSFGNYFGWNKDNNNKILQDFENSLSSTRLSRFFEYGSENDNLKVEFIFYKEDKDFLPSNLHRGSRSNSITVELIVDIPSLHDGNILHEDLANIHYSMVITNLEDVRYREDY